LNSSFYFFQNNLNFKDLKGGGFGLFINIILGIVGGVVGGWVFGLLGIDFGGGILPSIGTSVVGAVIVLYIAGLFKK